jgi:hypothetical protein
MSAFALTREVRAPSASLEGCFRGTSFEARKSAHLRTTAVFLAALTTSVRRVDPNQIVGIGVVELIARALVEYVRVDPVGP